MIWLSKENHVGEVYDVSCGEILPDTFAREIIYQELDPRTEQPTGVVLRSNRGWKPFTPTFTQILQMLQEKIYV